MANDSVYVVDGDLETLLSGQLCERLGIIKFNKYHKKIISDFPSVFSGLGRLKDYQVHLHVDEDVAPTVQAERPIPYHLKKRFDAKVDKMTNQRIVEDHEGPAPWVSNPVLAPKDDGDIRFTIDLKDKNKAILSTNVPIPRVEDIKACLSGCRHFSKLDFNQAFHQLEFDEESRKYTVFYANGRLMRHCVLPMGSKPASGELTKALVPLFADVPEAHIIHDDLILATKTKQQHDVVLRKVLTIIQERGLTLNPSKCIFDSEEIPFWGVRICKEGIKPDPEKVKCLQEATEPKTKAEVMSFLCFVQSFGDFIPQLSQETSALSTVETNEERCLICMEQQMPTPV